MWEYACFCLQVLFHSTCFVLKGVCQMWQDHWLWSVRVLESRNVFHTFDQGCLMPSGFLGNLKYLVSTFFLNLSPHSLVGSIHFLNKSLKSMIYQHCCGQFLLCKRHCQIVRKSFPMYPLSPGDRHLLKMLQTETHSSTGIIGYNRQANCSNAVVCHKSRAC